MMKNKVKKILLMSTLVIITLLSGKPIAGKLNTTSIKGEVNLLSSDNI